MARPRGKTKTARLTINLDEPVYAVLLSHADREDMPVAQVARRAIKEFLDRQELEEKKKAWPSSAQAKRRG